ncbi:hypothetical protein ABE10_03335, partial [Bacillus toyonensis]|nr:hypothetical protein [Bacillus toyonensis]
VVGCLLHGRVEAQHHIRAPLRLPGDDPLDRREELRSSGAGELAVQRALDPRAAAESGIVVAGDGAPEGGVGVDALEGEAVRGRHGRGDLRAADEDGAALDLVAVQSRAPVVVVLGELLRVDDLDPAHRHEQRQEHREQENADPAEFLGHPITTRG